MEDTIIISAADGVAAVPPVLAWGLGVIRAIQTIQTPVLTELVADVTQAGGQFFYMGLLALLYWCVDQRRAFQLSAALLISGWTNSACKALFKQPRPFDLDPSLGLIAESNYGLPSGHAQNSLAFWGVFFREFRGKEKFIWQVAPAAAISLVIGWTRLYLGVHFPTDLFAGWALATIFLVIYYLLSERIAALLAKAGPRPQCIVVAVTALIMNTTGCPLAISGLFLGMGLGYILQTTRIHFDARPSVMAGSTAAVKALKLIARLVLGLAVAALLFVLLSQLVPGKDSAHYRLVSFVQYAVLGAWVAAGAPWVFMRLKLA
jgi:membrane-associated phospholipid phosphatase